MRRRDFIKGIAVSTAAWSIAARAQQAMPVVGLLSAVSLESYADRLASIRAGLGTAGFVEGRNLSILYRSGDGQYEQLPALAADLVRRHVAVIVAVGTAAPALAERRDGHDSHCLCPGNRSGRCRSRRELKPARGKRDRSKSKQQCAWTEEA
jgi:putative ABC transport system substrate-binding protein